jgi:glycerol-3-phosphate dehydrogenase (NAD(P)+)
MPINIAVLGGGSWGVAVANLLNMNGNNISIWEFNPDDYESLVENRQNNVKLPGIIIPDRIEIYNDLVEAVEGRSIVCLAVPSHTVAAVSRQLDAAGLGKNVTFVNLAKGIDNDTLQRMSEVITDNIRQADSSNVATLSGPSHAEEVAQGMATSVVIGCRNEERGGYLRGIFSNHFFRAYSSPDIIGVETGGAFKNIIAIASGILDGLGGGDNSRGALFTRGLAEISRLGVAMGAKPLTFAGLSGLGDLVTTCISRHSRNRSFGEKIGKGLSFEGAMGEMTMVVEGVRATRAAYKLMSEYRIEMPITVQIYEILFNSKDPQSALLDLMTRDLKSEF